MLLRSPPNTIFHGFASPNLLLVFRYLLETNAVLAVVLFCKTSTIINVDMHPLPYPATPSRKLSCADDYKVKRGERVNFPFVAREAPRSWLQPPLQKWENNVSSHFAPRNTFFGANIITPSNRFQFTRFGVYASPGWAPAHTYNFRRFSKLTRHKPNYIVHPAPRLPSAPWHSYWHI